MNEDNKLSSQPSIFDKITLPISIIIAGLLVGGGFILSARNNSSETSAPAAKSNVRDINSSLSLKEVMRPIDANDHVLGNSDARIIIVEYSDPECPFCKMFHITMRQIMQDYGKSGKVAWVYRHFPIVELHKNSFNESVAFECAAALGSASTFWEYANRLYEVTPSNDLLEQEEITKIAVEVGLSSEKFDSCVNSGEFNSRVERDINDAKELGILGTPYSILIDTKNGDYYPLEGAYPYNQLKTAIDLILES